MKFKGTIGLVIVCAALAFYTFYIEKPKEEKINQEKILAKKVLNFTQDDIDGIEVIKKDLTIKIKKVNEFLWEIKKPLELTADPMQIDQLIGTLESGEISRAIEEEPNKLSDYGLSSPNLKIKLLLKSKDPLILELGDASPIGHSYYVKLSTDQRVLLANLEKSALDKSVDDLRDRSIFKYQTRDVTSFEIQYKHESQRFEKMDDNWSLVKGLSGKGDKDSIEQLLNTLNRSRVKKFVEENPKDVTPYGLITPKIKFSVKSSKSDQPWELIIGGKDEEDSYYAQITHAMNIFTVNQQLADTLSKPPVTYFDKSLIDIQEDEVVEIRLRQGINTIQMKRDKENPKLWTIFDPTEKKGDSETINNLLFDLKETRIKEFVKTEDLKSFGLHTPRKELTLIDKRGLPQSLFLGNADSQKNHYYASRSKDKVVFVLQKDDKQKIFRPLDEFQYKKIFSFDTKRVTRIQIKYPEKMFELIRNEKDWILTKPKKIDPIAPFIGKDILWTINNLEYQAQLNPNSVDSDLELGETRLTLSMFNKEEVLGQIVVGKQLEGKPQYLAKIQGSDSIYIIGERFLDEIPVSLDRFEKEKS